MYAEVVRRIVVVEPPLDWPREVNGVVATLSTLTQLCFASRRELPKPEPQAS